MTFSYSGDPSESELDAARFLIMDTNSAHPILQDEEIEYLIDLYGTRDDVLAYNLFRQAATNFSQSISRSLGPQSEDPTSRLNYYKTQAAEMKKRLIGKGITVPRYQYPKIFTKGMMDNPPASTSGDYV